MTAATAADCDRSRNLLFLARPTLWPAWPFLPLMRRKPRQAEEYFWVPPDEAEFLAMPKETFDSPEEVFGAGWRVD